jgi:PadR family transcriptional regulator, regulatory protein AphA
MGVTDPLRCSTSIWHDDAILEPARARTLMRITEPGEYAILGLLVERPQHGYALARQFAPGTELRQVVRLEMSQLYATLKKLETLGLIVAVDATGAALLMPESRSETRAQRGRRVYAPTPAGRAQLDDWLAQPVARTRDLRLMFLLKLFFALRRSHDQALALLNRQEQSLATFHAALADQLPERPPPATPTTSPGPSDTPGRFTQLVRRARLRQTEAALAWLGDLRADLAQSSERSGG